MEVQWEREMGVIRAVFKKVWNLKWLNLQHDSAETKGGKGGTQCSNIRFGNEITQEYKKREIDKKYLFKKKDVTKDLDGGGREEP